MLVEQSLADHFRAFAAVVERDGGTTYPAICRRVADEPKVLSILERAPAPQRRPLLLLAAVHSLLLAGHDHPLAYCYDTVASFRGMPTPFGHGDGVDVGAAFVDFCRTERSEVVELVASRSTQTNEVGRCTALLPGFCHVARLHGGDEPLTLLDLGTSAGLNLLFDDYAYTYRAATRRVVHRAGKRSSAVDLVCVARDDLHQLPELELPRVAERVGLDLDPVDPCSEDDALWLLACQWPDNPERFGRLRAALDNASVTVHPPRLVRGDMIDDLPEVASTVGGLGPLVVFHSWVAAYLDEDRQRELAHAVRSLDGRRPVHHLYCESPLETPGLPTPPSPVTRPGSDLATAIVHIGPAGASPVRLADAHPHGYWLRWWSPVATPR